MQNKAVFYLVQFQIIERHSYHSCPFLFLFSFPHSNKYLSQMISISIVTDDIPFLSCKHSLTFCFLLFLISKPSRVWFVTFDLHDQIFDQLRRKRYHQNYSLLPNLNSRQISAESSIIPQEAVILKRVAQTPLQ